MRFRHVYMGLGTFFVLVLSMMTDPDSGFVQSLPFGAGTVATLVILLKAILYTGFLHLTRKGLLDYFDYQEFINKAKETSEGAGSALIGVGLYIVAMAIVIFAATH